MQHLYQELKRRNVVRVAVAYLVVAWLLIQLAGLLEPALLLPEWFDRVVIVLLFIGFPIVAIVAWAFEITPDGIKKTKDVDPNVSITGHTGKKLEHLTIGLLALVVVFFLGRELFLDEPEAGLRAEITATAVSPASIAVLPFVDLSPKKDQEHFSKGISEEILNLLAKTEALRVAARTSAFELADDGLSIREIGEKLGVQTVLEGSVRTSGDKMRVTAQLINVADGYHLWSENYDEDSADIFEIQDRISGQILAALRVHLLPEEASAVGETPSREIDIEAYRTFLIGRERLAQRTRDDILGAKEMFVEALTLEPDYAPAHVGIAHANLLLEEAAYGGNRDLDAAARAETEAHLAAALAADPNLPEAIGVQGYYFLMSHRFDEADDALNRAIDLNPSYAQAYSWRAETAFEQEQFLDMLADKEKAYALDPMSLQISAELAREYISFWRPQDAERVIERMFELHPKHPLAYDTAIHNLSAHGRLGEAMILIDEALVEHPDDSNLKEWQAWQLVQLGLWDDAAETDVPEPKFFAKLFTGDAAAAQAILDTASANEDGVDWNYDRRMYLRVFDEGPASPEFEQLVQASISRFEERNVKWGERCMLWLIQDLRDAGRAAETEPMMQECHRIFEERLKARYLCPCSFYGVVAYTTLDGRRDEALQRADQWLTQGDSSAFLEFDPIFRELEDDPAFPEILARNAAQLERQREIYFAGRAQ
jgi:TolB-like protein/Flp pilus assembly protein TadD